MSGTISGGPAPLGVAAASKSADTTGGREHARQESIAAVKGGFAGDSAVSVTLSAAYGIASAIQVQEARPYDAKRRLGRKERGAADEAVDGGQEDVSVDGEVRHKVDVEA